MITFVYSLLSWIFERSTSSYSVILNESVTMNFRGPWLITFPNFKYLLSNLRFVSTSVYFSFEIISIRVWDEIFRSRLLGAVVQFTRALGNDVIKTLTSDFIVACL